MYKSHRFTPEIIQYAVWLYYRFALSHRNVDDLLAVGNNAVGSLLLTFHSGRMVLRGSKFTWSNANGTVVDEPLGDGKLPTVLGWLSGELENGDLFIDNFWEQQGSSEIVIVDLPEPSAFAAGLAVALGFAALRRGGLAAHV